MTHFTGRLVVLMLLTACTGTIGEGAPGAEVEAPPGGPGTGPSREDLPEDTVIEQFTCDRSEAPANPVRLWRLNREQLASTYAHAFGATLRAEDNPFEAISSGDEVAFSNMSRTSHVSAGVAEALHELAPSLVQPAIDQAMARHPCLRDATLGAVCLRNALEPVLAAATRRSADEAYLDFLVQRGVREAGAGGDGIRLAFSLLALSPQVLFRFELEDTLGAEAYAEFLAYSLTDAPPPEGLAERIGAGADLRAEARALLESPAGRRVLHRFVREYFDFDAEGSDEGRALAASTEAWVDSILDAPDFFRELLLSTTVYANEATADAYGVMARGEEFVPFELGEDQRSGMLTQPSFLRVFSGMAPVHRGLFVLRHLLCDDVRGTIPPFDPPVFDEDSTLRERLEAHRAAPECAHCHYRMDPLGFPLEQYDQNGRWRATEAGRPVDTTSELHIGTDIDGAFSRPRDLMERLADSRQARTCFVNHAFQFVYGRLPRVNASYDVSGADACTIADASERWQEGSLADLFIELVLADAARARTRFPEEVGP